jgi:hypothetical protein
VVVTSTYKDKLFERFIIAFNSSSDGISSKSLMNAFKDIDAELNLLFNDGSASLSTLIFVKKVLFLFSKTKALDMKLVKEIQPISSSALEKLLLDFKSHVDIRALLLTIAQQSKILSFLLTTLDHIDLDDSLFVNAFVGYGGVNRLVSLLNSWKQGI